MQPLFGVHIENSIFSFNGFCLHAGIFPRQAHIMSSPECPLGKNTRNRRGRGNICPPAKSVKPGPGSMQGPTE